MTDVQLDIYAEAETRKQQGMTAADENAGDFWKRTADQAIAHLASTGQVFEAYDLVLLGCPEPPNGGNAWGPRLRANALRGVIEEVGAGPSKRPTVARSLVRYWRGVA